MNVAIDPSALVVDGEPAVARRVTRIRLGMPQLCLGGLSETWALKECGDLHWRLLADLAGLETPDFRDGEGARIYAAFCALSAEDLGLDRFEEHDELRVVSELRRVSASRFCSRHTFFRGSEFAGTLELLSAFVKRTADGRNRSIARAIPRVFQSGSLVRSEPLRAENLSGALRKRDWAEHRGLRRIGAETLGSIVLKPCPSQDFNGANLLYFASYQGLADRADWELSGLSSHAAPVLAREMVFHGNAEPGEALRFELRGDACSAWRWMSVSSAADGRPLADVFTLRGGS